MRVLGKVIRWILIVIGTIEILFRGGAVISGNGTGQDVGFLIFWLVVLGICFYFETKSNKKAVNKKASATEE